MNLRGIYYLFLAIALTVLAGCGGGGGGEQTPQPTQSTQAIVKLKTSGSLPTGTLIGAISATLTYPTTKGLSVTESDVVLSGGVSGIFAPNVNTPGQVTFGNLNLSPGISIGEFLTATFTIAAGNPQVVQGDFAITGITIIDTNGNALSNITVDIQSVTIQ